MLISYWQRRFSNIDKHDSACFKGVAVMLLLFHHLFYAPEMFDGFTISFAPFTEEIVVHASLMSKLCVSMFAFVSGYGLFLSFRHQKKNQKGISRYVLSRYLKTMLPFFFLYAISFVVTFLIDGYPLRIYFDHGITTGILYVMLDFLGLAGIFGTPMMLGSWWYMSAAIILIVCLPLLCELARKIGWLQLVVLSILIPYAIGIGFPGSTNVLTFLPVFIIGMSLADKSLQKSGMKGCYDNKNRIRAQLVGIVSVTLIIFAYAYRLTMSIDYYDVWWLTVIILPVLLMFVMKETINKIPLLSNVLSFLGHHSMTIFVIHGFIRAVYLRELVYSRGNFVICFLTLALISIIVAFAMDKIRILTGYDKFTARISSKVLSG